MKHEASSHEQGPPPGSGWGWFYAAEIAWLVILIVVFYLFTRHFS
jgi:hypothetical protein